MLRHLWTVLQVQAALLPGSRAHARWAAKGAAWAECSTKRWAAKGCSCCASGRRRAALQPWVLRQEGQGEECRREAKDCDRTTPDRQVPRNQHNCSACIPRAAASAHPGMCTQLLTRCPPMGLRATMASKLRRMRSATSLRLKAAASAKLAAANCRGASREEGGWGGCRGAGCAEMRGQQQGLARTSAIQAAMQQDANYPPVPNLTGWAGPASAEPGVRASGPRAEGGARACSALDAEGGLQGNTRQHGTHEVLMGQAPW